MNPLFERPTRYLAAFALIALAGIGAYIFFTNGARPDNQAEGASKAPRPVATDTPIEGQPAPDFSLKRLNGEPFRLSDHRGNVVAINFWATWCPPCREEIPDLIALQEELRGDVLFVGVSLDKGNPEKVRAFAEEFGINYPIVIDDGIVIEKYGPIFGIPTTIFVEPDGRVRLQAMGMLTKETLRPVLEALVEGHIPEPLKPPFRRVTRPLGIE